VAGEFRRGVIDERENLDSSFYRHHRDLPVSINVHHRWLPDLYRLICTFHVTLRYDVTTRFVEANQVIRISFGASIHDAPGGSPPACPQ
jgi:hypothetical protein